MVAPIRDTRNKFFSTSASNSNNSNMASVYNDVDMVDDYVVNKIIFNTSNSNIEVRGCMLVPSATSYRFISISFSNKSEELYSDHIQRESDRMVQNEPVTTADSFQLEYAAQDRQNQNVSKVANLPSNMKNEHVVNVALTHINPTVANFNNVFNIQLNYDVNQALD